MVAISLLALCSTRLIFSKLSFYAVIRTPSFMPDFVVVIASKSHPGRVAGLCLTQTPCAADMGKWSARVVPWPVKVPGVGQALHWWDQRNTAQLWYVDFYFFLQEYVLKYLYVLEGCYYLRFV